MADIQLGKAWVEIVPSAEGISGKVQKTLDPEAARAGTSAGEKIKQSMGARLQSVGKGMLKAGAIATAVSVPIIAGIKKSMDAYQIQSAAETKLTEIYKTRMGVGKKAAQSTMDVASALQKQGIIGDEVALSGSQQLATFAKYPQTINTLMPAMENLLAQQKGVNATSEDAVNIGNLMGKVMMGQTGALKRVGVSFDENQEKILKYGSESEKAAVLAQVITDNVGHMNEEMAKTPEGKIQQLKNSLGDLQESVGAALAPALASAANWLSENLMPKLEKVVGFLQSHPVIGKITVGIAGLLAVGGPLIILIGTLITSIGAIGGVLGVVSLPLVAIVAGIAALAAGLIYAYKHSETFRNAINACGKIIKEHAVVAFEKLKTVAHTVAAAFRKIWAVVGPRVIPVIRKLTSMLPSLVQFLIKTAKLGFLPLRIAIKIFTTSVKLTITIVKTFIKAIKSIVTAVKSIVSSIRTHMSKVYSLFASPFNKAHKTISGVVDKIKNFFPLKLGKILSFSIPKISISSIVKKIGGKSASAPNFDVKFQNFARGAILDGPTLIGYRAGEAGREGVIPLEGRYMRPFANAIAGEMRGGTVINNNITVNGTESPEDYANRLAYQLKMQLRTV